MALPLGFLGKYPGCRCTFQRLDDKGECWARCDRRVESCEICSFGGNKRTIKVRGPEKSKRRSVSKKD